MASKSKLILLVFVVGALCSGLSAQSPSESRVTRPTKSPVNLLRGYRIQILPGIDSGAGRVWKEGGLNIQIEMCCGGWATRSESSKNGVNAPGWPIPLRF